MCSGPVVLIWPQIAEHASSHHSVWGHPGLQNEKSKGSPEMAEVLRGPVNMSPARVSVQLLMETH